MVGGRQRNGVRQRNVVTSKTSKAAANRTEVLNDAHGEAGVRGFIKRNITPERRSANTGRREACVREFIKRSITPERRCATR